jgi:CBS domain-containing protein
LADTHGAIPLIALDAIVFDTETTGLDPRKARIVEMGAVPLVAGRLQVDAPFRRLVQPGDTIPAAATRIHGIDDAAVAHAPAFRELWQELSTLLLKPVVIGHSIGFDLAVLKKECERAGVAWTPPRMLCTRMLAEIAEPELADYSLETLAARLGVDIEGRHSAIGDAITAARIFLQLVPKLRERNIRTLAEAEEACRGLTAPLNAQRRAGWVEPVVAKDFDQDLRLQGADTFSYRYRAGELMTAPAKFASPEIPLKAALKRMQQDAVSSLFVYAVKGGSAPPAQVGIVTERDVLRALARDGAKALDIPIGEIASRPLATVPEDAFAYLAMARMNRLKIRHLGVTGEHGGVVGALSARDLLRLRFEEAVVLGDLIEEADDVPALARAWSRLPQIAASLRADRLSGREVANVISRRLGALSERAAVLAERKMQETGQGAPPCPYAFAILGSAGRGESLLALDQDNALVFAEGKSGGDEDRWFEKLGALIADILHESGVPYCSGGVMAKNPAWRGSVATWRERVDDWVRRSNPEDLLSVDIFFDLRGVHGDFGLADALWEDAFDAAQGQAAFAKLLADVAGRAEPALGWFGSFKTDQGRIDLKKAGLFGIVSAARALAIRHNVRERATPARLAKLKALDVGSGDDLEAIADAQEVFLDLILAQQIADIATGKPPNNTVVIKSLSKRDRERLKAALGAVESLEDMTRDLLF